MELGASIGAFAGAAISAANDLLRGVPGEGGGRFVVNHDNILAAAKIIQNQADKLEEDVRDSLRDLRIDPPGRDVVSTSMAGQWNRRLMEDGDSYRTRVLQYVDSLKNLVEQLRSSAVAYGLNEQEIATAFGERRA